MVGRLCHSGWADWAAMDVSPRRLLGPWRLHRRLRDGVDLGTMTGTLTLAEEGDAIRWDETGVLRWAGQDIVATRSYLLRRGDDGWWVHFTDGRPFHPWTPGEPVTHPCAADLYRGLVRLDGPDRWRLLWDVTGPRKDQRILTRLSR